MKKWNKGFTPFRVVVGSIFLLVSVLPSKAEPFRLEANSNGLVLTIQQDYSDDGASKPSVAINGAVLRQFSFMQKISVAFDKTNSAGERIVVVHHWEGGNACAGALTVFSLNVEGFFQSQPIAMCAEDYEIGFDQQEPDALKITASELIDGKMKPATWLFLEDQMIKE